MIKKSKKALKGTSYYANQKQMVNGHSITWDTKKHEYIITDPNGKIATRKTELGAKNYANGLNKPSKKTNTMATRKTTTAKKAAPKKKTATTAKKLCSKVIKREGVKADGTLKKGYRYAPGGKIVKAKPAAKKPVAKKRTTKKK